MPVVAMPVVSIRSTVRSRLHFVMVLGRAAAALLTLLTPVASRAQAAPPSLTPVAAPRTIPRVVGTEELRGPRPDTIGILVCTPPNCPPPPNVTITPWGGTFNTPTVSVTIEWCGNATLRPLSRVITLNTTDVTASFSYTAGTLAGCVSYATSVGTITLPLGNNTFTASIDDSNMYTGSTTVTYTYAPPPEGVIADLTPHNGTNRNVALCVAQCFDQVVTYATPSYRSMDQDRSLTLVYRSSQAAPVGTVTLDVRDTAVGKVVDKLSLKLLDPNGVAVTQRNGLQETFFLNQAGATLRLAAQFDASGLATGAYAYTAVVTSYYTDLTSRTTSRSVRVLVLNERPSPYGAGWSVVGLERVYPSQDGGLAVSDGSGSIQFFAGPCAAAPCSYTTPPADFSVVSRHTWLDGTQWDRRYPDGTVVAYSPNGYAAYVQDRFGNRTTFGYDASLTLRTVTDPVGYAFAATVATSPSGTTISITDPMNRTSTLTQNIAGALVDIQDPAGAHPFTAPTIDATGLRQWTDRRGGVWNADYDCSGHLSAVTAPTVAINGTPGRPVTAFRHVDVATTGCAQGSTPRNAVLASNANATVTNARQYVTTYYFDSFMAPVQVVDALGRVTRIQRDAQSRVLSEIAPTGHEVRYTWDGPHPTQVTDWSAGSTVYTSYESSYGRPTHVWGNTTEQWFYYTGAVLDSSRARTATTPLTRYSTDSRGRVWNVIDPGGHEVRTAFEAAGLQNTSSVTLPGSRVTTFHRDAGGRVAKTVQADGSADSTTYDALNRVRSIRDGQFNVTRYDYDSLYLTTVTDAKGQRYNYAPNALGWLEQETRPNTATPITRRFDANGNVISITNRRSGVVNYAFDPLDRVSSQNAVTDGQTTTFGYSAGSGGSYQAVTNSESTDTLFFDGADRPFKLNTWRPNGSWYSQVTSFNLDGTRASTSATSNRWTGTKGATFTYAAGPALRYLDNFAGRTTFDRDVENLVLSVTYPNGLLRTNGNTSLHRSNGPKYSVADVNAKIGVRVRTDSMGRINQRSTVDSLKVYFYNADGSLAERDMYRGPGPLTCTDTPDFGVVCTGATLDRWETYNYDATGTFINGVSRVDPGNQVAVASGYTYTYDLDGNVATKSTTGFSQTFVWNSLNQLMRVTTSTATSTDTVTFGYDGFGRRVRKRSTGYLHDGNDLLLELDAAGNPVAEYGYLPGIDQPHSVTRGGVTYYLMRDEVGGSVNGMVRAVDNVVVAKYGYTPFGQLEAGSFDNVGNPIRFAAREYDSETGVYYFRARYYDPQIGRFLSEDPIGLEGGINLYTYAGNDPINGSDPSGLRQADWVCANFSDRTVCTWVDRIQILEPIVVTAERGRPAQGSTSGGLVTYSGGEGYPATPPSFAPVDGTRVAPPLDRAARMYRLSCQAGSIVTGWTTGAAGGRVVGAVWGVAKYGEAFADVGAVAGGLIGGLIGAEGIVTAAPGAAFGASAGRTIGYGAAAVYGARKGGQVFGTIGAALGTYAALSCH